MADLPFKLSYTDTGKGPVLILLHGFLESHTMWDYLDLQTHFRVIAIDLPGHGNSKTCSEVTLISDMAACVKKSIDHLKIKDFDIVGHSMGGYVALEYLEKYKFPGELILLNSNFWQDDEQKQADRLRVANLVLRNKNLFLREAIPGLFSDAIKTKKDIDALVQEAKEIPAEHIAACSIAMRNRQNHFKTVKKWAKKISILQGDTDKICPLKRMESAVVGLEINFICVPQAGHMSHIENSVFVRNSILTILANRD